MSSITEASRLVFFMVEEYEFSHSRTFDSSDCPRPNFSLGLILEGRASFRDCETGKVTTVVPGDIIFVPMSARYVSTWNGNTKIRHISMYFIFDFMGIFSRHKNFKIQKFHPENFEEIKEIFEYSLHGYEKDEVTKLIVLSKFYGFLSYILPKLEFKKNKNIDSRINMAIEYIEKNYSESINVEKLAKICNMSSSRFFPCFKKSLGYTPIEYLNNFRISKAIISLLNDEHISVENVSEKVGFRSPEYFRRVFKKTTGKNPRDYKKSSMLI